MMKNKKSHKDKIPRKMKKAMDALLVYPDNGAIVIARWRGSRRYPTTKWVVRASRMFSRLWREWKAKDERLRELEEVAKSLQMLTNSCQYAIGEFEKLNNHENQ